MYKTYLKSLKPFITFKSISTDPEYKQEMKNTATWLKELFNTNGFKTKVVTGFGNPLVIARYEVSKDAETCLIYGHYDVQPAEKVDGWNSEPFKLRETKDRLFARGAIDNKGQVMIHMTTIFELIKKGELKYNVTFLLEGDEESGGGDVPGFLKKHADLVKADFALISDGEMVKGTPVIESSFRGVLNTTITVETSDKELHSGLYGGAVPNAAHELTCIVSKLYSEDAYRVLIDEFYDDVPEISEEERESHKRIPFSMKEFRNLSGAMKMIVEEPNTFYCQVGLCPTIQVTGIESGYTGVGYKNAVPPKASAKINFRLVPEQDPKEIEKKLNKFVKAITPNYVKVTFEEGQSSSGIRIDTNNDYVKKAEDALKNVWKKKPVRKAVGGTLPIIHDFATILSIPQVIVPLANEDCRMHAVHENFNIEYVNKGLKFSKEFFSK